MSAPTLSTAGEFDAAIARRSLLEHPFYVAWSMGTLPVAALRDYAREYGSFIATISDGWRAAGDEKIARVEEMHTRVWGDTFAASLGTSIQDPQVRQVTGLVALAQEMFREYSTALGALYAFEAQQPFTAQSKLTGLQVHYSALPEACSEYFRMHQADYDEPAQLAAKIEALPPAERQRALDACHRMSQALYDALSGIHAPYVN